MARIIFTDGIGTAVLTNGKPNPANRFSNWRPNPLPIGDKANRQSDGALTMFRYRDDFGATFDLVGIPAATQRPNVLDPVGDITGSINAQPTSMLVVSPNTVVVSRARDGLGTPGDYGFNGLVAGHQRVGTGDTAVGYFAFSGVNGRTYSASVAVYIGASFGGSDVSFQIENGGNVTGSIIGHADLTKVNQWQILTAQGTLGTILSPYVVLRMLAPAGNVCYSDLWTLDDPTNAAIHMVDIAERLAYWLENGGTCQVETGDVEGNIYTTCQLAPGATAQQPVLSDRKLLEYTMSFALTNIAASPARMRCHYL